ncbi:CHAT domain-containing protein [Aquimarina sp. 2201CG14-23]|uniref:CHAT domain-containing protein n=1 Tax=Aquimarina mycalae TaxID=3040073 RepID=UPI0024780F4C|nr:CHAT domain-containing tetratricopeptide repeat protein [Aquimarina sp. 2201CG14-23]MDH7446964.1 CHAT domain-containing protein [Aquimarina sp. 2201CG14-23]
MMTKFIVNKKSIILLFLFCFISAYSQKEIQQTAKILSIAEKEKRKNIDSLLQKNVEIYQSIKKLSISEGEKIKKIDSLLQKNVLKKDSVVVSTIASKYANWNWNYKKRYNNIDIKNYNKRASKALVALSLSIKYHNGTNAALQEKLYRLAFFNFKLERYKESLYNYKKVTEIPLKNNWFNKSYTEIGNCLYYLGDYALSVKNYEIAARLFQEKKEYSNLISNYIKSYDSYTELNSKLFAQKSLKNLLFADSLSKEITLRDSQLIDLKRAIGQYYSNYITRNIEKGQRYLNEAKELILKTGDSALLARTYIDLARLHDEVSPKKAIEYVRKASLVCPKNDTYTASIIQANFGLNYAHLKKINLSLTSLKKSLFSLTGHRFDSLSESEKKAIIQENLKNDNLWPILRWVGEAYELDFEKTNNKSSIDSALVYYKLVDYTFDQYQSRSTLQNSKFLWRKEAAELYTRAIRAAKSSKNNDLVFAFMEKNKALLLTEEIHNLNSFQNSKLPLELINTEKKLQQKLSLLELENEVDQIISTIDSIEILQRKMNQLKPLKFQLDQKNTIKDLQKSLKPNQAVLEYHINIDDGFGVYPNKNIGYGILITKKENKIFELQDLNSLQTTVEEYLLGVSKPLKKIDTKVSNNKLSHQIYTTLFPIEIRHFLKNKEVIIIPDNYLNKIPFESLIVSQDVGKDDYLIYHNQISYRYSYIFHERNKNKHTISNQKFSAFAPVYFDDPELQELTESITEVNILNKYFNGQSFLEKKATKNSFFGILGKTNIIHLATHADANDSIAPWIAFSDQKMYVDELSLYPNNASLVVLSACNTTTGKIETGEGVMSLARSFFYGGAQSTVSSLWNVDDKSSQFIIRDFYKNINLGASKLEALHTAKINYLKNHSGSEVSPYYWASLILIGDTNPLFNHKWNLSYTITISLLIFLIITIIFMFLRKRIYKK